MEDAEDAEDAAVAESAEDAASVAGAEDAATADAKAATVAADEATEEAPNEAAVERSEASTREERSAEERGSVTEDADNTTGGGAMTSGEMARDRQWHPMAPRTLQIKEGLALRVHRSSQRAAPKPREL